MDPVSVWGFDARQIEEFEGDGFEHAVFAAMAVLALLNAGAEVQLAPVDIVRLAIIVAGFEVVSFVEFEFPHVLAHRIAPGAAASAKVDVIIDFAVVDQSSGPFVVLAAILLTPGGGFDGRLLADQMVNGESL